MSETIQTNETSAAELSSTIQSALSDYLSFSIAELFPPAPVSGSSKHDGFSAEITRALENWSELIVSDAKAVIDADSVYTSEDEQISSQLLGVGV